MNEIENYKIQVIRGELELSFDRIHTNSNLNLYMAVHYEIKKSKLIITYIYNDGIKKNKYYIDIKSKPEIIKLSKNAKIKVMEKSIFNSEYEVLNIDSKYNN